MAVKWTKDVYSTNVQAISWEEEPPTMIVTWLKGKRSAYADVPEDVAWDVANAPSVGSMINSDIKGKYAHRYV